MIKNIPKWIRSFSQNFSQFLLDPVNVSEPNVNIKMLMKVTVINHPIRYICDLPHTSTEHEIVIFPTVISDEDGSNRSSTSESDSESCIKISIICDYTKGK